MSTLYVNTISPQTGSLVSVTNDLTITGTMLTPGIASGSIAGPGSYIGVNASNQLVLTGTVDLNTVTALNNQAESRLVTIGEETTELDGQANLTFNGSLLSVTGSTVLSGTLLTTGVLTADSAVITQGFTAANEAFDVNVGFMGGPDTLDVTAVSTFARLTGSQGMLIPDDARLFFGTGEDASIEYDEGGRNRLIISGSHAGIEVTGSAYFSGAVTAAGALTADSAAITQGFTAANEAFEISPAGGMGPAALDVTAVSTFARLTGSQGMLISDDARLFFGTGEDASIEYDEGGTDELRFAGAAVTFEQAVTFDGNVTLGSASTDVTTTTSRLTASYGALIPDDKKLYFGTNNDAYISYDEALFDELLISTSKNIQIMAGEDGMFGYTPTDINLSGNIYSLNQLTLADEAPLNLGTAQFNHEGGIVSISAPAVGINGEPNVTFEVHYTGSKNPINLSNDTGGGDVVYFGTGSTVAGKLFYLNTNGGWDYASANATGSVGSGSAGNASMLGLALGTSPLTHGMLVRGFFDANTAYQGAWVTGSAVYIHSSSAGTTTVGLLSGAAPGHPGAGPTDSYVRIVGYCTPTEKVIYFNPDATWVENS